MHLPKPHPPHYAQEETHSTTSTSKKLNSTTSTPMIKIAELHMKSPHPSSSKPSFVSISSKKSLELMKASNKTTTATATAKDKDKFKDK
ncbi:hypothetical protein SESBI_50924, partial [Sesbania bispinosa]